MFKLSPLREPHANHISTTVYFYSRKLNRFVWCESNLEYYVAILLDHDPSVITYCEQAISLRWSQSAWTPDFVALLKIEDKFLILIIEVKYQMDLIKNRQELEKKYLETQTFVHENYYQIRDKITNKTITQIDFIVVTDQIIHQSPRVINCEKVCQSYSDIQISPFIKKQINQILSNQISISIRDLAEILVQNTVVKNIQVDKIWAIIYEMIYLSELDIDFETILTSDSLVSISCHEKNQYESVWTWFRKIDWKKGFESPQNQTISCTDLNNIAKSPMKSIKSLEIANERLSLILPLIDKSIKELKDGTYIFHNKSLHWITVYRWILAYKQNHGCIQSIIPKFATRGQKARESKNWNLLWEYGKNAYLTLQRRKIRTAYNMMMSYAHDLEITGECMSYDTFWRKIIALNKREVDKARLGVSKTEKLYSITEGEFPHGDFVLQSVQIDHTPIDVLVVDNENRLVTTRPFLTIAFDTCSRCVLGYYISYDKPSLLSISMTLWNCIQNKQENLRKILELFPELKEDHKLLTAIETSKWSEIYGLPRTLHLDNAKEFRCDDLQLFCLAYKINLQYRPINKPQFGARIERFLGTINQRLHAIPGTTFSNVKERDEYPSEKRSQYTIQELEARVLVQIVEYHEDLHSELHTTPLAKWEENFSSKTKFRGIDRNLENISMHQFLFDVLPSKLRTVQKSGVNIFGLEYANKKIERFIGEVDNSHKQPKRFRIRYDPRNILTIYFYNDHEKEYIPLMCTNRLIQRDFVKSSLSLWEWNAINITQNKTGKTQINTNRKVSFIKIQQKMDEITSGRTKSARIRNAKKEAQKIQQKIVEDNYSSQFEELTEFKPLQVPDPSIFAIQRPKELLSSPRSENSFSGMTRKKAEELAKQKWKDKTHD
jgi:putative transposase